MIFLSSAVSPLKLIKINTSFELIFPKSPCEQELASTKKEGAPTDESVEEIFLAIIPDLPTPEIITLPFLQLLIAFTALSKETLILFFNFFKDCISKSITCFAIFLKLLFVSFNGTRYLL